MNHTIVTDITFMSTLGREQQNIRPFLIFLSLNNFNPALALDLVECGSDVSSNTNGNGYVEMHCARPKRSLFVIVQEEESLSMKVCDFTVHSHLSDLLL